MTVRSRARGSPPQWLAPILIWYADTMAKLASSDDQRRCFEGHLKNWRRRLRTECNCSMCRM